MSPTTREILTALTVFNTDTIALASMVTDIFKFIRHFALSAMLRAILSDVTVYFVTIFLSHLLLIVTVETARVWFQTPLLGSLPFRDADYGPPTPAGFENPPCNVRVPPVLGCSPLITIIYSVISGLEVYVTQRHRIASPDS